MNTEILRKTWAQVLSYGDDPILHFYSTLFLANPEVRALFPDVMVDQRRKLKAAVQAVIDAADDLAAVLPTLQRLGQDHRRFGAMADHFPAVVDALLQTLEYYLGDDWTPEVADTWTTALNTVASVMCEAGREAQQAGVPACWEAPVLRIDRTDHTTAVLVFDPGPRFPYTPGCRVPIAIAGEPGTERIYRPEPVDGSTAMTITVRRSSNPTSLALLNITADPRARLRLGAPLPPEDDQ